MLLHFYIFMTALFAALLAVPSLRNWAFDSGTLDLSDERKVHKGEMPRLGGVAIFLAFVFSLLLFVEMSAALRGILAGAMVLFVTGLIDDLVGLSPKKKFVGEIFGTVVTMAVGKLYITDLGNLLGYGDIVLPLWLALPFTLFAVVGVINAINLIDGLDGLSGGVSLIALGAFMLLGYMSGNHEMTLICAALIGALLGFLKYNSYPARIFMGDVGSLVVGFILAFLAVHLTQSPGAQVQPIVPLIILGVPIIDTIWVMGRRLLKGVSPFNADMTHVHHKFLDIGFNHRLSVLVIYGISLFWATIGVTLHETPGWQLLLLFTGVSLVSYQLLRYIAYRREDFSLLVFDTPASLRSTWLFQKMVQVGDLGILVIGTLFIGVLLLAAVSGCCVNESALRITLVTLLAGVALLYITRDLANPFFLVYLFLVGLLLTVGMEQARTSLLFTGFSVGQLSDWLFKAMVPFIVLKIVFKRDNELFLSASLDMLVLAMCVSLALISPQLQVSYNLPVIVGKAIVLFLALKILISRGPVFSRQICGSVLASLVALLVRSI